MSAPTEPVWTAWQQRLAEAMRAELDWAPLRFTGWEAYERARPLLPGETYETVARWPEEEYLMVHRPRLGELIEAHQTPIEPQPLITVAREVTSADVEYLRAIAPIDKDPFELHAEALLRVNSTRTIRHDPPARTGRTQPPFEEVDTHYEPMRPRHSLEWEDEPRHDHAVIAYQAAGEWNLRLGAPVGVTRYGHLVYEPVGFNDGAELDGVRVTVEHNPSQGAVSAPGQSEIGIYRHLGLGKWHQTALVADPQELRSLACTRDTPEMKAELLDRIGEQALRAVRIS